MPSTPPATARSGARPGSRPPSARRRRRLLPRAAGPSAPWRTSSAPSRARRRSATAMHGTFTAPRVFSNTVSCTNGSSERRCTACTSTASTGARELAAASSLGRPRRRHPRTTCAALAARRPTRLRPPRLEPRRPERDPDERTLTWSAATDDVAGHGLRRLPKRHQGGLGHRQVLPAGRAYAAAARTASASRR